MDHFLQPRNLGVIEDADGIGEVGNAKCGDIMKMYLLEELSYEEMEISTGIRQGNLRQIVTRTRKKLKEQFIKIARTWKG